MGFGFDERDAEAIFALAQRLTGACQTGSYRKDVILQNVQRRMHATGKGTLADYLAFAEANKGESDALMSALTIHMTSFFREREHFVQIEKWLENRSREAAGTIRALCAACSTGEEPFSLALVFEDLRERAVIQDYAITGTDIDPVSVKRAQAALFDANVLTSIPRNHLRNVLLGSGRTEGLLSFPKEIRGRMTFRPGDLRTLGAQVGDGWDLILCRNVLIYFEPATVASLVDGLVRMLSKEGLLCLGHSEIIDAPRFGLEPVGNAIYRKKHATRQDGGAEGGKTTVLVASSSTSVKRDLLELSASIGLRGHVVSRLDDARAWLGANRALPAILDLSSLGDGGPALIRSAMQESPERPILVTTDRSKGGAPLALKAMEAGAADTVDISDIQARPDKTLARARQTLTRERAAKGTERDASPAREWEAILVGASTGGTEALCEFLRRMPRESPPVVVVQHITPQFSASFAQRLADASGLKLGQTSARERLQRGHLYMSTGDFHIGVARDDEGLVVTRSNAPPVMSHRPAVDILFESAARARVVAAAALLTGMGRDGARGLKLLKDAGCFTMAQDEASSVVYGMPKEAIALGAAMYVGNLQELRRRLDALCRAREVPGKAS